MTKQEYTIYTLEDFAEEFLTKVGQLDSVE